MPEKQIPRDIWIILIIIPILTTMAQSLSHFGAKYPFSWKDFWIQSFVGSVSGFLFGLMACWFLGNLQPAVGAIAGFGTVLGIHGVERIAMQLEKWLIKKLQ